MDLDTYLTEFCVNVTALAKKIEISPLYLRKIRKGHIPSTKIAKLIEEATQGNVTKEEILFPEEYDKKD